MRQAAAGIGSSNRPIPAPGPRSATPSSACRPGWRDLYRFCRVGVGMLANVYRDFATLPEAHQQALRDRDIRHSMSRPPRSAAPATSNAGHARSSATPPHSGPGGPYAPASAYRTKKQSRS